MGLAAARCFAVMACCLGAAHAQEASEAALHERYAAFKATHVTDSSGRMLQIQSRDAARRIVGEIYALLPHRFDSAAPALKDPTNWCEILLLHLDTKDCRVTRGAHGPVVHAGVVSHYDQPASTGYRVDFDYRLVRDTGDYLEAHLDADDGPLDTTDFRIVFEAMRADEGMTFAHMSYSYSYGAMSEFALRLYLLTFGRNKVGFSVVGNPENGSPRYIDGMRGVVERNTMRYYLAVEAWLSALGLGREARVERAMHNWYTAIEGYPRQLHEVTEDRYLAMKRREFTSFTGAAE